MTQSVGTTKAIREQCWRDRIAACEATGKSIAQWCRDEDISLAQYHWWKGELKRRERAGAVRPVFAEVRPSPVWVMGSSAIEVALAGERVVRVHPGFDAGTLSAVVRVLEGTACTGGA